MESRRRAPLDRRRGRQRCHLGARASGHGDRHLSQSVPSLCDRWSRRPGVVGARPFAVVRGHRATARARAVDQADHPTGRRDRSAHRRPGCGASPDRGSRRRVRHRPQVTRRARDRHGVRDAGNDRRARRTAGSCCRLRVRSRCRHSVDGARPLRGALDLPSHRPARRNRPRRRRLRRTAVTARPHRRRRVRARGTADDRRCAAVDRRRWRAPRADRLPARRDQRHRSVADRIEWWRLAASNRAALRRRHDLCHPCARRRTPVDHRAGTIGAQHCAAPRRRGVAGGPSRRLVDGRRPPPQHLRRSEPPSLARRLRRLRAMRWQRADCRRRCGTGRRCRWRAGHTGRVETSRLADRRCRQARFAASQLRPLDRRCAAQPAGHRHHRGQRPRRRSAVRHPASSCADRPTPGPGLGDQ